MTEKVLFALDGAFGIYGIFWAGLVFVAALPLNYNLEQWLLVFSIIAILLYPLIRKAVKVLLVFDLKKLKQSFEKDWTKDRAKKRWEY